MNEQQVSPGGRRGLLKAFAGGVAGLLGVAAVRSSEASTRPVQSQSGPVERPVAAPTVLTYYAPDPVLRNFVLDGQGPTAQNGQATSVFSELFDQATGGSAVGEVRGFGVGTPLVFGETQFSSTAFQMQVLTLPDGTGKATIFGQGTLVDGNGVFAIVGGTGKFTGVTGRYTVTGLDPAIRGDVITKFVIELNFPTVAFIPASSTAAPIGG